MTRIEYTLLKEYGELISIKGKGKGSVTLKLLGAEDGTLCIGELSLTLKGGEASADLRCLPGGVDRPLLVRGRKTLPLEPIMISGDIVSALPTEDSVIRMLLKRMSSVEERLAQLQAEQKRLDAEIMGKDLIKELFE